MDDTISDLHLAQADARPQAVLVTTAPQPGMQIADAAALEAAIVTAQGGEVFTLAPGNYGGLNIDRLFETPITLKSDGNARFSDINIAPRDNNDRAGGVILDGVDSNGLWISRADGVSVSNSTLRQIKASRSSEVHVERNHIHDGHFGLRFEHTHDFSAIGNVLERAREDNMRVTGDSWNGVIRGNVFLDLRAAKPIHGDHLQIFGIRGQDLAPHDLLIEQNLMHDNANAKQVFHFKDGDRKRNQNWTAGNPGEPAPAQGVFIVSGQKYGYRNVTIRRNLMRLSMMNAIFIASGKDNYLIEENIIAPVPNFNIASIRLQRDAKNKHWTNEGVLVTRNITPNLINDTPEATVTGDNFVYGWQMNGLFAGITTDAGGDRPEDYRLAPGSRVPTYLVDTWLEDTIAVTRATLNSVTPGR